MHSGTLWPRRLSSAVRLKASMAKTSCYELILKLILCVVLIFLPVIIDSALDAILSNTSVSGSKGCGLWSMVVTCECIIVFYDVMTPLCMRSGVLTLQVLISSHAEVTMATSSTWLSVLFHIHT